MLRLPSSCSFVELVIVSLAGAVTFLLHVLFFQPCCFFCDSSGCSQGTKCRQDLDVIRSAVNLHDAQNEALRGTSLRPLLGRYLQEIPSDPWGGDYLLDARVGIILSFGEDARSGGTGSDKDLVLYYKAPLRIQRAFYEGPDGHSMKKSRIVIRFNKPYRVHDEQALLAALHLITDRGVAKGGVQRVPLCAAERIKPGKGWKIIPTPHSWPNPDEHLVIEYGDDAPAPSITKESELNFYGEKKGPRDHSPFVCFGLSEVWHEDGPLDAKIFGKGATLLLRRPEAVLSHGNARGKQSYGVPLEPCPKDLTRRKTALRKRG